MKNDECKDAPKWASSINPIAFPSLGTMYVYCIMDAFFEC